MSGVHTPDAHFIPTYTFRAPVPGQLTAVPGRAGPVPGMLTPLGVPALRSHLRHAEPARPELVDNHTVMQAYLAR